MVTDEKDKIRRQFDEKESKWYYSVVDVIGILTESSDARNYWKVLKNRLKKAPKEEYRELVTKCNQLKMLSRDGKYYLTDVMDALSILDIIKSISPPSVESFRQYFNQKEKDPEEALDPHLNIESEKEHLFPYSGDTPLEIKDEPSGKLKIDVCETGNFIIIQAMIAGISIDDIFISVNKKIVTIRGKREMPNIIPPENYLCQELFWGSFENIIELPEEIEIDNTLATEYKGLVTIKLSKINKTRTQIIKIKSI